MKVIEISHENVFPRASVVSEKSGIYAWYFNFNTLSNFLNDKDELFSQLERISKGLSFPTISGRLKGNLGSNYSVIMNNVDFISSEIIKTKIKSFNKVTLENLFNTLNLFSYPIYIGVANNLRIRYENHLKDYTNSKANSIISDENFGQRLLKLNLDPRELNFKFIEFKINRAQLETIEYIANRIFKPISGRR